MRKWRMAAGILMLAATMAARQAKAQVMADRVPADAVAYAGWAGTDAAGSAYDASHLKAFLNSLNLWEFITAQFQSEMAKQTDPQGAENNRLLVQWLTTMAKAPTAVYVSGVDFIAGGRPQPHLGLFSKVGKQNAEAMAAKLDELMQRNPQADAPLHGVMAVGDYLLLYVGDRSMQERLAGAAPADNLASNEAFKRTMAQLGPAGDAPVAVVYGDAEAGLKTVATIIQNQPDPTIEAIVPVILEGAGLNNLRQIAWAGKFDGANWKSSGFIGMKERRNGLLAFWDIAPLPDATFKMIPKDVTTAGVFRFDGNRLLADIADTATHINDQAPRQLEQAYQQIFAVTGIDLKRELLPALGDEFVYYGASQAAGDSLRGFTMINKLRDPAKAASAMEAAENFANLLILQRNPDSKAQFHTQPLPAPLDKVTAHVMTFQNISPSWAINDGTLFFSLTVQGLQSAMEKAAAGGTAGAAGKESILDNPQFAAMRKSMGHDSIGAFSFVDLVKGFPETYEIANWAVAQIQAENPGMEHPYVLPPLEKLVPALGPALTIYWTDKEGYHFQDSGPFPAAGYLDPMRYVTARLAQMAEAKDAQPAPASRMPGGAPNLP